MAPRKGASDPEGPAQVVERTLNQTKPGLDEHGSRIRRFNAAYDVWRGNTGQPQGRQANDWQSRLRVKYGMQVIDQALVNLVQGVPRARVTPRRREAEQAADGVERLLGYFADLDHLGEKEAVVCQQALVYGLSPAKTHWLYCEEQQTRFAPSVDEETGVVKWAPAQGYVVTADRPTFEPWDAYATWWDPTARDVDSSAYFVFESWQSRDQLEEQRWNEADGTGKWRNLDLLYASGDDGQPPDSAQNQMLAQPQGAYRGRYRIWEVWRKTAAGMRLTVIGNRKVLLKDGNGPYWMSGYPVTVSNSRPDLFRLEGVSEAELVDHLQQAMWTVHNLRMEQLKSTVMRGATVRMTIPDMNALVMQPNFRWPVMDHDDVKFQDPPPLPPEAYRETETLLSLLQYVTGITPYVGGASGTTSGVDQTTATGVSLLTESASRLLQFKARIIRQRTWQRTFEQWADLSRQFLRRPLEFRVVGDDGIPGWQTVGPEDVNGDFDIRIEAGDEAATRQQERGDAVALINALIPLIQAGLVNSAPLVERAGKAFGVPEPKQLIATPPALPQAAPNGTGSPLMLGTGLSGSQLLAPHPSASLLQGNQR